ARVWGSPARGGFGSPRATAPRLADRLAGRFDLEVDGMLTLGAAHDIASGIEGAIREELGPSVEVETHIEPMEPDRMHGRDAPPQRIADVAAALKEIAPNIGLVGEIHDVRVREADAGEIVNFHCVVSPSVKVAAVHDKVDELERALRLRFPSVRRVIGHAEPASGDR